jgi:molecular chaperone GrpE
MADKKKKNTEEVSDSKKLAALEARLEGLNEELEEAKNATEEATKKTEEAEKKADAAKADYLRLMAEFDTFRRRTAEEKLALVGSAATDTIKGMLPVLDDLERAMEMLSGSSDEAAKEGTTLIYDKLFAYLKGKGLEVIEAKGQPFDTDLHEAVSQFPVPDEEAKGKVFDVVQTGYKLGGKVIRYAKVVVGV